MAVDQRDDRAEREPYPGAYYDLLLVEAYERGEFSPRGTRKDISGLVITFLVPPEYRWSDDP